MDDILVVQNLVKHFPIRRGIFHSVAGSLPAVSGISFSIRRGSTFALVGESGSGKTTVGRTILRLIEPTSGQVIFDGKDVFNLRPAELRRLRRQMQIVFQDPYGSLNPRMTIGAMLAEPLLVHGINTDEPFAPEFAAPEEDSANRSRRQRVRRRVAELLRLVGLAPDHADRYPHEFSGGQRQRIGIARALALRPKLIVCDEAVSALDVSIQAQILNLLDDLQRRFGLTYLFIAHDLSVVRHISDRVAVMYLGEIVEEAPTEEIFSRPLHPYTQALLQSIPVPIPHRHRRGRIEGELPSLTRPAEGCPFQPRCPIAVDECRRNKPPLDLSGEGHLVACLRTDVSETTIETEG
jgi:oligopeptide/dipeptide ABC transporter ATP-binding protein